MDKRLVETNHTRNIDEFNESMDRYYIILDDLSGVLVKNELSIDEGIMLLDALISSLTEYNLRAYQTVKDVMGSHK